MSVMNVSTWEMQAGDLTAFAFKLSFLRNPHGGADRATPEEAASWGSFAIWAGGENLCAHLEQGEVLGASHWYMLPFMEWLTDAWDSIFHEEQLPLRNAGTSAASSMAATRKPPISLKEVDEFEWLDDWIAWWDRHNVRSRREGGLFPDLYLRRYRDTLEISTGAEKLVGIPDEFAFLTPHRRYLASPIQAAEAVYSVLSAGAAELARRLPGSSRVSRLVEQVRSLASGDRNSERMAWLVGLGEDAEKYAQLSAMVDAAFVGEDSRVWQQLNAQLPDSSLVVAGSSYAQLVYGAYSPDMTQDDVVLLARTLVQNYVPDASQWLSRLDIGLDATDVKDLSPGEQGSALGELACELLNVDSAASWIDIQGIAGRVGIDIGSIPLSDSEIRAISIFGPTQQPKIFCNPRTKWGQSREVLRFSIAHELCHLLLDRGIADELAVASGPWAPLEIEQRANAFAAAILMPTWLLRDHLASLNESVRDLEVIAALAGKLHVSVSSMIDRLCNLGELDAAERFLLKSQWRHSMGQGNS